MSTDAPLSRGPSRPAAQLARIRENQRCSRARRKEYLNKLEERVRKCEQQSFGATLAMQMVARQVVEENARLRDFLYRKGHSEQEFNAIDEDSRDERQSCSASKPSPTRSVSTLAENKPTSEKAKPVSAEPPIVRQLLSGRRPPPIEAETFVLSESLATPTERHKKTSSHLSRSHIPPRHILPANRHGNKSSLPLRERSTGIDINDQRGKVVPGYSAPSEQQYLSYYLDNRGMSPSTCASLWKTTTSQHYDDQSSILYAVHFPTLPTYDSARFASPHFELTSSDHSLRQALQFYTADNDVDIGTPGMLRTPELQAQFMTERAMDQDDIDPFSRPQGEPTQDTNVNWHPYSEPDGNVMSWDMQSLQASSSTFGWDSQKYCRVIGRIPSIHDST